MGNRMKLAKYIISIILVLSTDLAVANVSSPLILLGDTTAQNWTVVRGDAINANRLTEVTKKDNNLVAIGTQDKPAPKQAIINSLDKGSTWNASTYYFGKNCLPVGLAANQNGLVMAGNILYFMPSCLLFSADGNRDAWRQSRVPDDANGGPQAFSDVAANTKGFMAIGKYGALVDTAPSIPAIWASPDGTSKSWNRVANLPSEVQGNQARLDQIIWTGEQWLVLGVNNEHLPVILNSMDGVAWSLHSSPVGSQSLKSIATHGNEWFLIANADATNTTTTLLHSLDQGNTWQVEQKIPANMQLNKIHYDADIWIAVGKIYSQPEVKKESTPIVLIRKDGSSWQQVSLPFQVKHPSAFSTLNDVIWTGNNWVAVGAYDNSLSACLAFNQGAQSESHWRGQLQNITVNPLSLWVQATADEINYPLQASISYQSDGGQQFEFGVFNGTCVEQNDGSVILNMNFQGKSIEAIRKSVTDNTLTVTKSCLEDQDNSCKNFTGPLSLINSKDLH
jgi:hypothetical protein